jgi:release factor glutamine methyltransferase
MSLSLSVGQALAEARDRGVERLDAQLLLAAQLQHSRAWLLAHDDAALSDTQAQHYRNALMRRTRGEPVAYILGEKEFHGLSLKVDANVLVPRPDTETLVDWALEHLQQTFAECAAPRVVDLGTGSGAIALAVKHRCPRAALTASDASAGALAVARANGERLGLAVDWRAGHWWDAIGSARFELALANPPYIAAGDAHLAALTHEPAMALSSGADGLDAMRHIVAHAAPHLVAGAWLLLEHGADQAAAVRELLGQAGFTDVQSRTDLSGMWRCSGARLPVGA